MKPELPPEIASKIASLEGKIEKRKGEVKVFLLVPGIQGRNWS